MHWRLWTCIIQGNSIATFTGLNRIHKTRWKYVGIDPQPIFNENDAINWILVLNEFYVRDVNGKEMAVYKGITHDFWNVWGLDNAGKINTDNSQFFYLKDHLGV